MKSMNDWDWKGLIDSRDAEGLGQAIELARAAELDAEWALGVSPLELAVEADWAAGCQELARWQNPNRLDEEGSPWLMAALARGKTSAALGLASVADVNRRNAQGDCAVHVAVEQGQAELAAELWARGDQLARGAQGETALGLALLLDDEEACERVSRALIAGAGDDALRARDMDGDTPLVAAIRFEIESLSELLARKTPVEALWMLGGEGHQALTKAVDQGMEATALILIERDCAQCPDGSGKTPFEVAMEQGSDVILEALSKRVDPLRVDARGWTPLDRAWDAKRLDLARELSARAGAAATRGALQGQSPVIRALEVEDWDSAALLARGMGARGLRLAAQGATGELAQALTALAGKADFCDLTSCDVSREWKAACGERSSGAGWLGWFGKAFGRG
jgi:ankyrin repeat protein